MIMFSLSNAELVLIFTKLFIFRSSRFSSQGAGAGGEGQAAQGGAGGRQEEEARGAQAAREFLREFPLMS